MMQRFLLLIFISLGFGCRAQQTEIRTSTIQKAIERGEQFLRQQQQPEGSFRDSLNNLFEIWETIIVTDALLDHNPVNDDCIIKALTWLREHESPEQLVCHNQKCMQAYCLETSALYLQLLKRVDPQKDLSDRLQFITELQQTDGHWEVGNPDVTLQTGFPSVTGFIINLLKISDYEYAKTGKAFQFLAAAQLADGSWGSTWEYYGCPGYALWQCLPALRKNTTYKSTADRGRQYILNTQSKNGSWAVPNDNPHHISEALHTVFMLLALAEETDSDSQLAIRKGILYLIDQQRENGCWDGGLFPIPSERYQKSEYLITTALICKVLSRYKKMGSE